MSNVIKEMQTISLKQMDCINKNDVNFKYTLSQTGNIVGTYTINLKIEG